MKNKLILPLLSFFFLIVISYYCFSLYSFAKDSNGWIIGDWLINFDAGFVRRGLSGHIIMVLSDLLGLKPNFTVMWVQITFYVAYMSVLFYLIYRKKINIWFLILLLSPATLLFPIFDYHASGRKEIILFLIFGVYILCLRGKILKYNFVIFVFAFALLLATLSHELIFFYTPYFILAAWLKSKIDHEPFHFNKPLLIVSGSILITIPIYLFGKFINGPVICSGLLEKGLSGNICKGIISWPTDYGIKKVLKFAKESGYYKAYGTAILLGLAPFVLFIKTLKHPVLTWKKFLLVFLLLLLFSSPLYVLGLDWGRWINIHLMLLLFMSTLLLNGKSDGSEASWSEKYLTIPALWKSISNRSKQFNNLVFTLIFISYITLWYMGNYGIHQMFSFKFYSMIIKFFQLLVAQLN